MLYRNDNMLLRIAQADAFASAVEYVKDDEHLDLHAAVARFDSYQQHPTHRLLRPGMYTDDAQMSIAVAEVLLEHGRKASMDNYYDAWYRCFKRDPRDGYSRAFQKLLESSISAIDLRRLIRPDSDKNGAAMRSVPLGVLPSPTACIAAAFVQASTTHATPGGINSSVSVALMSHYALHEAQDFSGLFGWVSQHHKPHMAFKQPWRGPVTGGWKTKDPTGMGVGMNTAWAVQTLLTEESSLMGIMRRVLDWGGDTDSVGAIAWGIASCRYQDEALPDFLECDLERGNPKYGPVFLKGLGTRLMEAYS